MDRAALVALVISRFLGKSYSFTAHAADIYTKASLAREKINNASFMITVSQYNKQHLLKSFPGINADKIHVLHPWVDVYQFTPSAERPAHERLHILSVGRLVEKKGHIDLIDALYFLHTKGIESECQIVGDGPLHTKLREHIVHLGLQDSVHLLGGLPQAEVMKLLREWADVFVLPCVIARNGDRDGIPVSLAEAMAMELPVISTDIVGIRELVQPGTGILVPPHDPVALADALHAIAIQDRPSSTRMGRQGREIVDSEFNLLKGTQELAGLFYQIVWQGVPAEEEKHIHASS
jgi:glycosyltransferase involved in cell wall biosynthesis